MPAATASRLEQISIVLIIALLACVAIHQAGGRDAYPCKYAQGNPYLKHLAPKFCATLSSASTQVRYSSSSLHPCHPPDKKGIVTHIHIYIHIHTRTRNTHTSLHSTPCASGRKSTTIPPPRPRRGLGGLPRPWVSPPPHHRTCFACCLQGQGLSFPLHGIRGKISYTYHM